MTETPVEHLVAEMSVPTVISMLITSFYNMVDTLYVGHMSTTATGAVGVCYSAMCVIQAVGFFFGHGSGNYISRALGRQDVEQANKMAATGFFSAIFAGTIIMAMGLLFRVPLVRLLGATETIAPEAEIYLAIIMLGAPYMTSSLVLNNQLRYQGNAFFAMIGLTTGAALNLVLDPLLIFIFRLGVAGAALATILSQLVSFLLLLWGTTKGDNLHIRFRNFSPSWDRYRSIIGGGLPSLCRQGLGSISVICLNRSVKPFGDSAIAAFSVVSRVSMFANSAIIGFGQGFQPVCGFNYGAKLYHRVKNAYWFCVKVATTILVALSILGFAFAPQIISLFRASDPELIRIGAMTLRLQCLTLSVMGCYTISNMMLQTTGKTLSASVTAMSRQGLFFLPLLWLLPQLWGLNGIMLAQPLSDLLSFVLAMPLAVHTLRKMGA